MFEAGIHRFTHVLALDIDLDATGAVLQRAEAGLAHHPFEHHAAGHLGHAALGQQAFGRLAGVRRKQGVGAVSGFEVVREGHALALGLQLAQRLELLAALQHQLVLVLDGGGGGGFRHGAGARIGQWDNH